MTYDPAKAEAVGAAIVDLVIAVTDGVNLDDMDEMLALIATLKTAQTELAQDTDAAILHIISGATDAFGTLRINPPVA